MTKRLPAEKWHISKKAKMTSFAGYYMPLAYSGIIEEHIAVRERAGFFDISHMGQILVKGIDAAGWLNTMTCNDIFNLNPNKAQYSMFLNEKGGVIDDIIVYMISVDEFLIVVNAANLEKDYHWLKSHEKGIVKVIDKSEEFGLIAIAGKKSRDILSRIIPTSIIPNSSFYFKKGVYQDYEIIVSATGYTGEEITFEIFLPADKTVEFLDTLYSVGSEFFCLPCGIGARDSLRIEASLPLYGNELKEDRTPLESDLRWVVKLKKPSDFIGKKAIERQLSEGYENTIGYFILNSQGPIPRTSHKVFNLSGEIVGEVTSGTYSPLLEKPIFMAFVNKNYAVPGSQVYVKVRDKNLSALAVEKPFLKLLKKGG